MMKNPFEFLLIGVLAGSLTAPAYGVESTVGISASSITPSHRQAWSILQLPPVPYLESMPLLGSSALQKGPKIDILWRSRPDLATPFFGPPKAWTGDYGWDSGSGDAHPTR